MDFHMLSLLCFKEQWMLLSMCCRSTFNKQCMGFHLLSLLFHHAVDVVFHMLSLLCFKEQCMLLSMCCHSTFNKQWMGFHLLSLLFHHTVDVVFHMLSLPSLKKKWIWFSVCCHCTVLSRGWFSICRHFCALSSVCDFAHVVSALFQKSVRAVFLVVSLHIG